MQTEQPTHDLVDFAALAAQLTNEQKILAALEAIKALLARHFDGDADRPPVAPAQTREEQIAALANKTMGKRK